MTRGYKTVWIFHGDEARHAAGVFESKDQGLEWAERHGVSGILTKYPVGNGCYDIALEKGFAPKRPHHGTAKHVGGFSSGWEHVHITNGNADG